MRTDPAELVHKVARRIAELRTKSGLTQEELAVELGVTARWIRRIEERGENLTLHTLAKLANALDVKVTALLQEPAPERSVLRPGPPRKKRKG